MRPDMLLGQVANRQRNCCEKMRNRSIAAEHMTINANESLNMQIIGRATSSSAELKIAGRFAVAWRFVGCSPAHFILNLFRLVSSRVPWTILHYPTRNDLRCCIWEAEAVVW